jgi:hypothetical protein
MKWDLKIISILKLKLQNMAAVVCLYLDLKYGPEQGKNILTSWNKQEVEINFLTHPRKF